MDNLRSPTIISLGNYHIFGFVKYGFFRENIVVAISLCFSISLFFSMLVDYSYITSSRNSFVLKIVQLIGEIENILIQHRLEWYNLSIYITWSSVQEMYLLPDTHTRASTEVEWAMKTLLRTTMSWSSTRERTMCWHLKPTIRNVANTKLQQSNIHWRKNWNNNTVKKFHTINSAEANQPTPVFSAWWAEFSVEALKDRTEALETALC